MLNSERMANDSGVVPDTCHLGVEDNVVKCYSSLVFCYYCQPVDRRGQSHKGRPSLRGCGVQLRFTSHLAGLVPAAWNYALQVSTLDETLDQHAVCDVLSQLSHQCGPTN